MSYPTPPPGNPWSAGWPLQAGMAASFLCCGTAISSLFFQHVSNDVPQYYYSIAVLSPTVGMVCYSLVVLVGHCSRWQKSLLTFPLARRAMMYCVAIGGGFALNNLLVYYGQSGSEAGVPDVPVVLSMVLQKLVVPYSLALESALDRRLRPAPACWEATGVAAIMAGVAVTVLTFRAPDGANSEGPDRTARYYVKLACLVSASVPLALGFYVVGVARRKLPEVTGTELWAMLCLPELAFSILLTAVTQWDGEKSLNEIFSELWNGIACVAAARQPAYNDGALCHDAATFYWAGIPFAFAFNLAIPVLIKHKGPTSAPLFRALALPMSALVAMTNIDPVIHTPFSWDAVFGVIICTLGLILYYGRDIFRPRLLNEGGYTIIADEEENDGTEMNIT